MLSQSGQYAIRAMVALASRGGAEPLDAARLASSLNLPSNYLSKILQALARDGLLRATRGIHGGYCLARPLEQITLYAIVAPFEHLSRQHFCLMGRPNCGYDGCCALHTRWRPVVDAYLGFLQQSTLADLVDEARPGVMDADRAGAPVR